ncbi:Trm112 family protein [Paenochrobactrum sp. BZR 588]|uniref:Trm112 family protein n=1 Tax=Paenochrobactrum TaxID=999488 RepID=UPI0035BC31C6
MEKAQSQGEVDISLLELLVCPLTKTALRFDRENNELISQKAKLAYPVRDGVPIMLPSEARIIE